jgi:hypothetical protein
MPELVYALCSVTSLFCAFVLFRSYRSQRTRLLLWSTLCFAGLAASNMILVIDLIVFPEVDLRLVRTLVAYCSILVFLLGLVWESR